jgi:hypothetical protein
MFMNLLHAFIKLESSTNVHEFVAFIYETIKVAEMFMNLLHASIKLESSRDVYEFVTCIF